MSGPFVYASPVEGKAFIGRDGETKILCGMLTAGKNVVLFDSPKSGKSSLLRRAIKKTVDSGQASTSVETCLYNLRSPEEFITTLGSELIGTCGSSAFDLGAAVTRHLGGTNFYFDPNACSNSGRILSMKDDATENDIIAVLSLPFKLAKETGNRFFVTLDEFHCVMQFEDGEAFCKIFEKFLTAKAAEGDTGASYIFCGSRYNAMEEIFDKKRFFFRCCEKCVMNPIDTKTISEFVTKGFLMMGKDIDRERIQEVCASFRNHIGYITHFCAICDSMSKGFVMEPILKDGMKALLSIHEPKFKATMYELTSFQISMLRAVMDGNIQFSSAEVISRYGFNSSANVRRLKDALYKKEVLGFDAMGKPFFLDPLFEYWLKKEYFRQ